MSDSNQTSSSLISPEDFWKSFFKGFTARPLFGNESVRTKENATAIGYQVLCLNEIQEPVGDSIRDFLTQNDLELSTLLQGAVALLLSRYSGEEDILFGIQVTEIESTYPTLPFRVQVTPDAILLPWLQKLQTIWQTLQTHSQVPWSILGKQIKKWNNLPSEMPLFEGLLILDRSPNISKQAALEGDNHPLTIIAKTFPELTIQVRYDCNRFQEDTISRLLRHLQVLLEGMVIHPDQCLCDLSILTAAERHQILVEWNSTQVDYPSNRTIHELFTAQVTRTPDAIAVVLPLLDSAMQETLTYQELNDRANFLAYKLQELGVGAETFVAMCFERSLEMMVAILGILKAGGVYVPLDPAYPQDRLTFMLEDTQAPVLLTQSHLRDRLPPSQAHVICLEANWGEGMSAAFPISPKMNSENLAYINYTSGSTGRPKGVAINHRAVLRLVLGNYYTRFDNSRTILQFAPISFDAATFEIWGALLHGGCCVLFPNSGIPDPKDLGKVIQSNSVTTLFLTTALFNTMIAESPEAFNGVQELLTGGEAISMLHVRHCIKVLPDLKLIHVYGPTESTTFSCFYPIPKQIDATLTSLPIGKPIANTESYILDSYLQPVPIGVSGELYIGGDGLAREYLNLPEITRERFIPHPFRPDSNARLYKTGDLAKYLPDGNIDFIGRKDNQVKIRGYRIELGEIESALEHHDSVAEAVVVLRDDIPSKKHLVAYVTSRGEEQPSISHLKAHLKQRLAEYMIPTTIVVLDKIPLTPNGKADRKALPAPKSAGVGDNFIAPNTPKERQLAEIWCSVLSLEQVGIEDNFFDMGGTSLLGLQMVARVQKQLGSNFRAVKLYQYPTVRTLAQYLDREESKSSGFPQEKDRTRPVQFSRKQDSTQAKPQDLDMIAIVGMAGRFPGADNVEAFWCNLCNGVESYTVFSESELDPSVGAELRSDPNYVRVRGTIAGAETFDAAFFGISPREAEVMDPQARIFLELAHTALENSGYTPEFHQGAIGLYAGSGQNTYFEQHICGRTEIIDRVGAFQTMLANEKDFVTTRTSYKLGLTGPSLSINTACSTSLVAVIQAFQGLVNRDCDLALAGGISITTPQNRGYLYQEGSMLSPDGHCRPFDANAQGTLFNSGAGIVVLKRLTEALDDGDRIYAVIRGVGLNNDGTNKVSFTAPSVNGQASAIARAQAHAGINPETITYIETHGTATPLGDPIEIEALTQAFRYRTSAKQFCAIGSAKSNFGHLVAAAGVTGLIKTALALYHKQIPPSLNYESPNPEIDFANSPFYVNTKLVDWKEGETPRRAGVSSFGVGGTNAHVVLEEAPEIAASSTSRPYQLLRLSAKTKEALEQNTANLKEFLKERPEVSLADTAYTLHQGRKAFNHRRFVVCRDLTDAIATLESLEANRSATRVTELRNPDLVFMFPGQGSQYVNMGRQFYEHEVVFQSAVDRCAEILKAYVDRDLRDVMYPSLRTNGEGSGIDEETAATLLRQTQYTQPALFTIEYALAQLWQSWGVHPAALIGHSIGEFVAACLAGVFSLEDGLKLVATRAGMMGALPSGSMLSVRLPAEVVEKRIQENKLNAEMAIAAINGPNLCVVSGSTDLVTSLQQQLEAEEIVCRSLHTSHAFHSPMMDSIVEPFAEIVKKIQLSPPQIPFVSTVTADWITDAEATDPMYWASHLRTTVRFAEGSKTLWQEPERVLLEVGPRTTMATLARQQAIDFKRQIAISSLGSTAEDGAESVAILQAIGQLWLAGVEIDRDQFYADEYRHRIPLPTYPFERKRFWIDAKPANDMVPSHILQTQIVTANLSPPATPDPIQLTQSLQPSIQLTPTAINPIAGSTQKLTLEVQSQTMTDARKQQLLPQIQEVLESTSGLDIQGVDGKTTFLEMGMDSLSLTQVATALKKKFKVKVTFRHLLEDYSNLDTLSEFVLKSLPTEAFSSAPVAAPGFRAATPIQATPLVTTSTPPLAPTYAMSISQTEPSSNGNYNSGNASAIPSGMHSAPFNPQMNPQIAGTMQAVVAQQLQIMTQQLQLLSQSGVAIQNFAPPAMQQQEAQAIQAEIPALPQPEAIDAPATNETGEPKPKKNFGPGAKIEKTISSILSAEQKKALDRIIARYTARTPESKRQTQEHRKYLADPRTVSGFTPLLKEMVYPIVTDRAHGSKLWDVDGNEYVDLTNGFGLNFFGWSPDFVTEAVKAQLDLGIEIGPQTPLAGKVAKLVAQFTGMERVAFCNTGSEAVMATMRLARTVTGRDLVATFAGDYHGTFDEALYRQGSNLKTLPASPGILPSMFENLLVLDYNSPESLQILRDRADDLAAILVEPVRSRDPNLQPKEFLQDLRSLTEQSGSAFIFDEVVTGFRVHPGGAQAYFNIQADMATYGKVVGGGLPIGILAGKAEYMDALDGGFWQYGDNSIPEVGVTFFAGTFVRHPMALAAAEAVLLKLKAGGPELQRSLTEKVTKFADRMNQYFKQIEAKIEIAHFSSFFYINYPHEMPYASLLFYLLREKGVHIWDHRPCFFTLSHTDADIEFVIRAFKDSVAEMQMIGFLPQPENITKGSADGGLDRNRPPQPGARLGRDPEGNPAWYVPDLERPGKYLQVGGVK
ncbi:amino acid adenylation domain-containing protein [Tumidithrix elongata RA019]|uniref:Amino acid adenylation domain-containing protein n=1 Tax=Tumidithrix elongata BACA0141 TaxID=2716417 RepID=A0AAW9PR94_9CYAN|nr:amino acid adenylation domain-containing protein [Tumidithrix elongata RA019]